MNNFIKGLPVIALFCFLAFSSVTYARNFETSCLPSNQAANKLQAKKQNTIRKYGGITIYHQGCYHCQGTTGLLGRGSFYGSYCIMTYENGR